MDEGSHASARTHTHTHTHIFRCDRVRLAPQSRNGADGSALGWAYLRRDTGFVPMNDPSRLQAFFGEQIGKNRHCRGSAVPLLGVDCFNSIASGVVEVEVVG